MSTALQKVGRIELSETGANFPEDLSDAEFKDAFKQLRKAHASCAWWIGDAIVFGQKRWGDKYNEALAATDLEYQTLMNYACVCSKVVFSRRRENLSFSHHYEVASLPAPEQKKWLDKAEEEGWSKSDLRCELRKSQATMGKDKPVSVGFVLNAWVTQGLRFLRSTDLDDEERRENIKRTLKPLVDVWQTL